MKILALSLKIFLAIHALQLSSSQTPWFDDDHQFGIDFLIFPILLGSRYHLCIIVDHSPWRSGCACALCFVFVCSTDYSTCSMHVWANIEGLILTQSFHLASGTYLVLVLGKKSKVWLAGGFARSHEYAL